MIKSTSSNTSSTPKTGEFNVPEGATPFTPSKLNEAPADNAVLGAPVPVDPSRTVPGIMTPEPDVQIPAPEDSGPKVGQVVNVTTKSNEKEPEKEKVPLKMCPACGCNFDEFEGEIEISEKDKERWLSHILGEERFMKEFELYNGRIKLLFRTRTTAENDNIFNHLGEEINAGKIPEVPAYASPAYVAAMYRLMLVCSLVKIVRYSGNGPAIEHTYPEITDDTYPPNGELDTSYAVARAETQVLAPMNEGFVAAIMAAHRHFETLVSTLIHHSEDPDFWKPVGERT